MLFCKASPLQVDSGEHSESVQAWEFGPTKSLPIPPKNQRDMDERKLAEASTMKNIQVEK